MDSPPNTSPPADDAQPTPTGCSVWGLLNLARDHANLWLPQSPQSATSGTPVAAVSRDASGGHGSCESSQPHPYRSGPNRRAPLATATRDGLH